MRIELGPMCPKLQEQLKDVRLTITGNAAVRQLDADVRAVNRLYVRQIITETQYDSAMKKLMARIQEAVKLHSANRSDTRNNR